MTPTFPIELVFPPQGHFTQPYLALPCIKAWLVEHGLRDVELLDANIEAYDWLLSRPALERAWERVQERLPLEHSAREPRLAGGIPQLEAFRAAAESAASARALIEGVDAAKRVLRGAEFWDPDRYVPAVRTLYAALRLASAAHHPSQLTPHNFTMRYSNERSSEVLAALEDEAENPFLAFYRERVLPRLVARRPRLLGLSIIYGSQLIPGLTLARLVKQALPDCHVTAGGGFLAYIGRKLLDARTSGARGERAAFADCLDSLVFHEGEQPLLELARALESGSSLAGIGSLSWFERTGAGSRAVHNAPGHPIRLDAAPAPDFDGLPLELYFSPELVIPYDINRGCYYGECTFCTLPTVIGPGYRTRRAETIAEHVSALARKLGTRNVNFITDCMPPGMIRDLPEELIARRADLRWWADARVEPKAYTLEGARRLHESGCRKLLFGFETATPRLLKLMQKGQSVRATLEVARNCAQAGISVTFYAMVGFPTETRAEAQATLDLLVANADVVREVSLQTFHIDEVAHTYRDPAAFGIRILPSPEDDLALYHDYEADAGMTQAEAAEAFEHMLAEFRRVLPLFAGDNIFYFMQKSHYFLHLARGTSPDEFAAICRARAQRRALAEPDDELVPAPGLALAPLAFSHGEALRQLGSPAARAVRPDFLTGRYVAGALEAAAATLPPLERRERVLAYAPDAAEFAELAPGAAHALRELARAGSLGALLRELPPADPGRAALRAFAGRARALGLLVLPSEHAPRADQALAHASAPAR
jgi:anaerobic magnesium-protoporphyrin IX monomethyl ester cyclase